MAQEQTIPDAVVRDDEELKRQEAEERRLRRLRRLFPFLLVIVFLVYAFTTNLIPSSSMEPSLNPGDQVLTMRSWLAYFGGRTPARGDIVIFTLPPEQGKLLGSDPQDAGPAGRRPIGVFRDPPGEILIKRIVGLPGETITLSGGKVLANGRPIDERYRVVSADPDSDLDYHFGGEVAVRLGPDEVFVMGDNRQLSEDSRFFGPVKLSTIRGRYLVTLFHRNMRDPAGEQIKRAMADADRAARYYRTRRRKVDR